MSTISARRFLKRCRLKKRALPSVQKTAMNGASHILPFPAAEERLFRLTTKWTQTVFGTQSPFPAARAFSAMKRFAKSSLQQRKKFRAASKSSAFLPLKTRKFFPLPHLWPRAKSCLKTAQGTTPSFPSTRTRQAFSSSPPEQRETQRRSCSPTPTLFPTFAVCWTESAFPAPIQRSAFFPCITHIKPLFCLPSSISAARLVFVPLCGE